MRICTFLCISSRAFVSRENGRCQDRRARLKVPITDVLPLARSIQMFQPHFYDLNCKQIGVATFHRFNPIVRKVWPAFL
jgi:hypothetical protein